jgi:hypothetical protein
MTLQQTAKFCEKCKKQQNFLIWCNACVKFYCWGCFKEYEVLRQPEQHSHSYAMLLGKDEPK